MIEDEFMKEKIIESAVLYVVPLLLTGLVALLGWVGRSLKAKFEADGRLTLLEKLVLKTTGLAEMIVRDVEATTKRSLEEKAKDGLTSEEYKQLRDEAIAKLKASLGERGLAELKSTLGIATDAAMETFIGGAVEKAVTNVSVQKAIKAGPSDSPFAKMPGGLPPA